VNPDGANLNVLQSYEVQIARKGNRAPQPVENLTLSGRISYKPVDNIGNKPIPDYPAYAGQFVYEIAVPGCATPGRVV
jgi:hypothetical protein